MIHTRASFELKQVQVYRGFLYILQHLCFVFHRYFSTIFPTRVDQEDGSFPFVNIFRVLLIIIFLFLFMLEIRCYNWTRD